MSKLRTRQQVRPRVPHLVFVLFAAVAGVACVSVLVAGADTKATSIDKGVVPPIGRDKTAATASPKKPQATPKGAEPAIRATAAAFVKAFNAGNAKAVAELWAANGTVAEDEGKLIKGQRAIEAEYAALFKQHPTARIRVAIQSIEFPTPTTAIEDGISQLLTKDNAPPSASRYTAVHVLENGKWLMASVRESALPDLSNFSRLQELGWLVGTWEAKAGGAIARSQIRWIANKSFLEREFSVSRDGLLVSSGTQIVGWDPGSEQVVSWTFDSSGGHGSGQWMPGTDGWRIQSAGITADGVPTSSLDHLVCVPGEANIFGWRSVNRKLGNAKVPDVGEVVFDRVAEKMSSPRR